MMLQPLSKQVPARRWDALRDFKPRDRSSKKETGNYQKTGNSSSSNKYRSNFSNIGASGPLRRNNDERRFKFTDSNHQQNNSPPHCSSSCYLHSLTSSTSTATTKTSNFISSPPRNNTTNLKESKEDVYHPLTNELMKNYLKGIRSYPQEIASNEERLWQQLESTQVGSLTEHLLEELLYVTSMWTEEEHWTLKRAMCAERILFRMENEELNDQKRNVSNNHAKTKEEDSEENKRKIISFQAIKPTYQHYINVIHAYACTPESDIIGERAGFILDHLDRRAEKENRVDLKPNRLAINTVMGAYCKSTHPEAAKCAERLLNRLEIEYEAGCNCMKPSRRSYSKVIDAYARRGDADDAYKILLRMVTEFENGNKDIKPCIIIYTNVMDAFAKSRANNAPERAEAVLRFMLRSHEGNSHEKHNLDCKVFSVVINAWAQSNRAEKGRRAMDILDLMNSYVEPDLQAYNIVINSLTEDDRDIHHAEDLLNEIEKSEVLVADHFTYNSLLKAYCKQAERRGAVGAEKAQKLINHWEYQYKCGHTRDKPDYYSYFALIKAWGVSNVREAALRADGILSYMEENNIKLSKFCYNAVLQAWSRSYEPDAAENAERVFQKLLIRYQETGDKEMKPDKFSYFGVIAAHTRSLDTSPPYRAESLLREMVDNEEQENPDNKIYSAVISAWARSTKNPPYDEDINTGKHAEGLIDLMLLTGTKPDTMNMNAVITAYVNNSKRQEDSQGALAVLNRMHQLSIPTSSVTYTILLKACNIYSNDTIEDIFHDCINHGMLDDKILKKIMSIGRPAHLCKQIFEESDGGKGVLCLPSEWSRNANRGPASKSRNQYLREYERCHTNRQGASGRSRSARGNW